MPPQSMAARVKAIAAEQRKAKVTAPPAPVPMSQGMLPDSDDEVMEDVPPAQPTPPQRANSGGSLAGLAVVPVQCRVQQCIPVPQWSFVQCIPVPQ